MWQLTALFGWLPSWFWLSLLMFGVAAIAVAWFLPKIPYLNNQRFAIQAAGIIFSIVSIWFLGASSNEEKWQERMKEAEEQIKAQEEKAVELNKKLEEEVQENKQLAEKKNKVIYKEIEKWKTKEVLKEVKVEGPERVKVEEVIKYIENCPVPKEMLNIHNEAATPPAKKLDKSVENKGDKK